MDFKQSKIKIFFVMGLLALNATNCTKDNGRSQVPNVSFDIFLNITNQLNNVALGVGQGMLYPGGFKGIIIYKNFPDPELPEFNVYERCCTTYPNDTCTVLIDSTGFWAKCPCCKSQFWLNDGSVKNGPAKFPLKQYQTFVSGSTLEIRN
jgi:Rieske Fe-S protein